MKRAVLVIGVGALAAGGYGLYELGLKRGAGDVHADPGTGAAPGRALASGIAQGEEASRRHMQMGLKAGDVDPATGRKILYYHDPMVPANKFEQPGKSPYMDMMLVPVYAGGDSDDATVTVSPRIEQNLGLRTAKVVETTLSPQVSAVGSVAFNERDQVVVQARATGFVERLYVRATLDPVRKGQPLADLYVPDWVAAQEEFLAVRRMQGTDLAPLLDGARARMRQAGMTNEQIALIESTGRTQPRITLAAPIGGVVVELMAREGMTVMAGATLFRINGLGAVWANAEVPESQAGLVRPGAKVLARSPAFPGVTFDGHVQAILPEVNPATRTLKARMELANPSGRLAPGMFVTMQFTDLRARKSMMVPTDAVIQTGRRSLVMLAEDNGRFRPVEVETGIESGGQTEIKQGLKAGQQVVVSSQFLIDSEASLRGLETRLGEAPKSAQAEPAAGSKP
ncbi:MAG TPA: efflux RND transporter periplasmic adaptor subunit [Burkholderiaceae bacterium]|nr:efflux RND transporter periplasmic adaptor subunit [Burkholderiaceae bacterium]